MASDSVRDCIVQACFFFFPEEKSDACEIKPF